MLELAPAGDGLYKSGFAGDTFNTVWYVAQLSNGSVQPMYLTAVGDDAPSREMLAFMQTSGIAPLAKHLPGKSIGLYKITLVNGERSFSYWRSDSAARALASDMDPLPVEDGDVVYFSGITLAILSEKDRATLLSSLRAGQSNGAKLVFDPNLRPRLWSSPDEMRHWTMAGAAMADICLPSFEDEATHFGDRTPSDTCRRYSANGSPVVVVKNGPDPIKIQDNGAWLTVEITSDPQVADTTAAGDSFNAMLLLRYMHGDSLEKAASDASLLSADVISRPGALVEVDARFCMAAG